MANIWLIGAGPMAREYAKVLKALSRDFICIGRSEKSAKDFEDATGTKVMVGGLAQYLTTKPQIPDAAIIASSLGSLAENTVTLLDYGVKRILCEKPGFQYPDELERVKESQERYGGEIYYAYNRRFYASTIEAERIIKEDGGVLSFNFEFTEWAHVIGSSKHPKEDLNNWFYANSTHVVDLAFFLGGKPVEISCYSKDANEWHRPVNFAGAGLTERGALFNYQANWEAPGRWAVELLTAKHRIYLKPMEQLQLQDKGSVKVYPVEIDDHLDKEFKPGLFSETNAFLNSESSRLCSIQHQVDALASIYKQIAGI